MNIALPLHREIVAKAKKISLEDLTGLRHPCIVSHMPNQRHPDKETLSVYLPRTLMARLRNLARARKTTVTSVVEDLIYTATKDVSLSPEDYELIAQETRKALQKRGGI